MEQVCDSFLSKPDPPEFLNCWVGSAKLLLINLKHSNFQIKSVGNDKGASVPA